MTPVNRYTPWTPLPEEEAELSCAEPFDSDEEMENAQQVTLFAESLFAAASLKRLKRTPNPLEDPEGDKENQVAEQPTVVADPPSPFAVHLHDGSADNVSRTTSPKRMREPEEEQKRPVLGELSSMSFTMMDEITAALDASPKRAALPPKRRAESPISPEKLPTRLDFRVLPAGHENSKGEWVDSASLCNLVRNRAFLAKAAQRYMAENAYDLDKQDEAPQTGKKALYGRRAHAYSVQSRRATEALEENRDAIRRCLKFDP